MNTSEPLTEAKENYRSALTESIDEEISSGAVDKSLDDLTALVERLVEETLLGSTSLIRRAQRDVLAGRLNRIMKDIPKENRPAGEHRGVRQPKVRNAHPYGHRGLDYPHRRCSVDVTEGEDYVASEPPSMWTSPNRRHTNNHRGRHEEQTLFTQRVPPDYAPESPEAPAEDETMKSDDDYVEYVHTLEPALDTNANVPVVKRSLGSAIMRDEADEGVSLEIGYRSAVVPYSNYRRSQVLKTLEDNGPLFTRHLANGRQHSQADVRHQGNLVGYISDELDLVGALHNGLFYPLYIQADGIKVALSRVSFNVGSAELYEVNL